MTQLLDTCVLVDYLRGREPAIRFVESLVVPPTISVITVMELTAGVKGKREETGLAQLFSTLSIIDIDAATAKLAGEYLRQFAASHALDPYDALIAASANQSGHTLATRNTKHFPMFPGLQRPYEL